MPELSVLEKSIAATIVYYDVFNYPLTLVEIHKWLFRAPRPVTLGEVRHELSSEKFQGLIEEKNGFYFLHGRQGNIEKRLRRYQLAEKKFKVALRAAGWLKRLAFVEMISVCNTLGYSNAAAKSDIDLFIVIKAGRLWWSRLLVTFAVSLLGIRRHDNKITDRICLSFYISDSHYNIEDIRFKPDDIHLAFWLTNFSPIYGSSVYQDFFAANNWLAADFTNLYPPILSEKRTVAPSIFSQAIKQAAEFWLAGFLGNKLEQLAKAVQLKKIKTSMAKYSAHAGTEVVISDSMLKFHENDRRAEYQAAWQRQLNRLGI